jgi:Spy/CpxP family protein refolding chaperone
MRTVSKVMFTLGLAALLATPALAQRPGGGFGRGGGGGLGQLLTNESVQKELKVEKDDADKLKDAVKKVQDDNKDDIAKLADRSTSAEDRADITKKLNEAYTKAVSDILNADQKKRLGQIELQQAGLRAFTRADVVKALNLTDDEKSKLKDLSDDYNKQMQELRGAGGGGGGGGRGGNFQKMAELRKDFMDKSLNVLTDDQKKTWKDMTGEPFQLQFGGGRNRGNPPARTREA